jgi:hypothetical protein
MRPITSGSSMTFAHLPKQPRVAKIVEETGDVELGHETVASPDRLPHPVDRLCCSPSPPVAETAREEDRLEGGLDDLAGRLLHDPVGHTRDAERTQAPVRLWDLDSPHRRRDVALRRQQPLVQRRKLAADVGVKSFDRLTVDPCCTRICSDNTPGSCEVGRIGDLLQELADGQHLLVFSAAPLAPWSRAGRQTRWPGPAASRGRGARFATWSRSAPSPVTGTLSDVGPPVHVVATGQRALPRLWHYYEPSDSSEGVGLPFPLGL